MSEETEWHVQVTYNLPPTAQFEKGNMLNVRAKTVDGLNGILEDACKNPFLIPFFERAEQVAAPVVTTAPLTPEQVAQELGAEIEKSPEKCPQCGEADLAERSGVKGTKAWKGMFCSSASCNYVRWVK